MKNLLRILAIGIMTVICGGAVYGIIYSPRLFKVLAILILLLTIYLLYLMIRNWLRPTSRSGKGKGQFVDAEIINENENKTN